MGQLASTMVLNLVLSIFQMVMGFGLALYTLRLYRGQECGPSDLFAGFSMVGRVIGQQVLIYVIAIGVCMLLTIPMSVVFVFAAAMNEVAGGVALAVGMVLILVLAAVILLNYALAPSSGWSARAVEARA